MKAKRISAAITLCIVLGILIVIANAIFQSTEASRPVPMPPKLEQAEFSTDDGESWQPVGDGSALRRHRDNVRIRGHFNYPLKEGWFLNVYLQHMQMELFVNGVKEYSFAAEFRRIRPEWCADLWVNILLPEITQEDVVEFRLSTLHRFGIYSGAYEKFLSSMLVGEPFLIYQWINAQNILWQIFGLLLLLIGCVLLCVTFAAFLMNSPLQKTMLFTALLALGEGLFWLASASEITYYVGGSVAFFNIGRSISRMLTVYALLSYLANVTQGKRKAWAGWIAGASGVISIIFLILEFLNGVSFCEVEWLWHLMQAFCLLLGLVICSSELLHTHSSGWGVVGLLSFLLAYASIIADSLNLIFGWYPQQQMFSKYVCGAVALGQSAALLVQIPASYAAIKRAEKLSEELHNSRIVLAMSQIRTHFIFNVLNAISSLCKSAPELADQELVRFSRYLRNNIDIMQEDRPIPFEKALEHMHNYVDLEQLRFDEKILLDESYECMDFMIPSLVIQPLVENAIKHGLLPKEDGGVISVGTQRCGDEVMIEIADNGVGFDTSQKIAKTSVGLSNVRFRVERMMNGRMKLESTPGKGTVVRVWLPCGKEETSCTLSM